MAVSTLDTTCRCLWTKSPPVHNNQNDSKKQEREAESLNAKKRGMGAKKDKRPQKVQKVCKPESSEKLECGTQFEPEPGGEVRLGEQRKATTVDLVVSEHLQHHGDGDGGDDGGDGDGDDDVFKGPVICIHCYQICLN